MGTYTSDRFAAAARPVGRRRNDRLDHLHGRERAAKPAWARRQLGLCRGRRRLLARLRRGIGRDRPAQPSRCRFVGLAHPLPARLGHCGVRLPDPSPRHYRNLSAGGCRNLLVQGTGAAGLHQIRPADDASDRHLRVPGQRFLFDLHLRSHLPRDHRRRPGDGSLRHQLDQHDRLCRHVVGRRSTWRPLRFSTGAADAGGSRADSGVAAVLVDRSPERRSWASSPSR